MAIPAHRCKPCNVQKTHVIIHPRMQAAGWLHLILEVGAEQAGGSLSGPVLNQADDDAEDDDEVSQADDAGEKVSPGEDGGPSIQRDVGSSSCISE